MPTKFFRSSTNKTGRLPRRSRAAKSLGRVMPSLELLEDRVVPAITLPRALGLSLSDVPMASNTPGNIGYIPSSIAEAYGYNLVQFSNGTAGTGAGQTVAIIDAGNDSNITADLNSFSNTYTLPNTSSGQFTFTILNQSGTANLSGVPAATKDGGLEEALDVEWVHALAPRANILLIEAQSLNFGDLTTAVDTARKFTGVSVVSMSFGGPESADEAALDSHFTTPAGHGGVTFIASAGDNGRPMDYPAASPNVLAVGGTNLTIGLAGTGTVTLPVTTQEQAWQFGGGGVSAYEPVPSYQSQASGIGASPNRVGPDVAFAAADGTGLGGVVTVVDTYLNTNSPLAVAGTSFSAPAWAALIAIADQGRALDGLGSLDGPTQTLPAIYALPASDFNDITTSVTGQSGGPGTAAPAGPGFDQVTGRGTPNVRQVVADLSGNAPPGSLFSDNFQRSLLGSNYFVENGTATDSGTSLQPTGTARADVAYLGASQANVFETVVGTIPANPTNGEQVGLIARYQGSQDAGFYLGTIFWYAAPVNSYEAGIYYLPVSGAAQLLGNKLVPIPDSPASTLSGTLGFSAVGSEFDLYWKGSLIDQQFDSSMLGAGLAGLEVVNGTNGASSIVSLNTYTLADTPPAGQALTFSDNFVRSDSSNAGAAWEERGPGVFQIQNNQLKLTSLGSNDTVAVVDTTPAADVLVSAHVSIPNAGSLQHAGLVARYQGPGVADFYLGLMAYDSSRLAYDAEIWYFAPNGSATELEQNNTSFVADPVTHMLTGTLGFEALGTELELFWNNAPVVQAADARISSPGLAGIEANNTTSTGPVVAYDTSFSIGEQAAPTLPFNDNFQRSSLGNNYDAESGTGATVSGNALVPGGTTRVDVTYVGVPLADVSETASVTIPANPTNGEQVGLIARYQGSQDAGYYLGVVFWYAAPVNSYEAGIYYLPVSGAAQLLGNKLVPIPGSPSATLSGTLGFQARGSEFDLYWGGSLVDQQFDSSMLGAGLAGLEGTNGTNGNNSIVSLTNYSLSVPPPAAQVLPFSDNFQRSLLGSNYYVANGMATVPGNGVQPSGPARADVVYEGASLVNVYETASVTIPANPTNGEQVGLLARYQGSLDAGFLLGTIFWYGSMNSYYAGIFYVPVSGTAQQTLVPMPNLSPGSTVQGTLGFSAQGSNLELFWNNTPVVQTFSAGLPGAGLAGVEGVNGTQPGTTVTINSFNLYNSPPFSDPFSGGAGLNGNWTTQSGSFQVSSGTLQPTGSGPNVATVNTVPLADANVAADVVVPNTSGDYAALVARFPAAGGTFYEAGIASSGSGYTADIWSVTGGIRTVVTATSVLSGTGHLALQAEGNQLLLTWDDVVAGTTQLLTTVSDATISPDLAGLAGSPGVSFDNFSLGVASTFIDLMTNTTSLPPDWAQEAGSIAVQPATIPSGPFQGTPDGEMKANNAGFNDAVYTGGVYTDGIISASVAPPSVSNGALLIARYQGPGVANYYEAGLAPDPTHNQFLAGIWYVDSGGNAHQIGTTAGISLTQVNDLGGLGLAFYFSGSAFALYANIPQPLGGGMFSVTPTLLTSGADTSLSAAGGDGIVLYGQNTEAFEFTVNTVFLPTVVSGTVAGGSVRRGNRLPSTAAGSGTAGEGTTPAAAVATGNTALADLVFGATSPLGVSAPAGSARAASDAAFLQRGDLWFAADLTSAGGRESYPSATSAHGGSGGSNTDLFADALADGFTFDPVALRLRV